MNRTATEAAYEGTALQRAVRAAAKAAQGDSNDTEIEALQEALGEALTLLGVTFDGLAGDVPQWWEVDDES